MKSLFLVLSVLLFLTSCDDVENLNSDDPINAFADVENILFAYTQRGENKYLVIDSLNKANKQFEVLTYEETSSGSRTNSVITIFNCYANDCITESVNSTFQKIELSDKSETIVVKRYRELSDRDELSSSSTYERIED